MEIAPALQEAFERLNEAQRAIVVHEEGPLLVIAGPGSGKTHSLTLLAMNLFLCGKAQPEQLVLCTYTEKAARTPGSHAGAGRAGGLRGRCLADARGNDS